MSYMMRDRPDGQFEIVMEKPVLLGVFPERDMAERFIAFLKSDERSPMGDGPAETEDAFEARILEEVVSAYSAERASLPKTSAIALPAVVKANKAPAIRMEKIELSTEQLDAAFARISANEKIGDVAADFGVTMHQLRSHWALHCKHLQKHLAEGGQEACSLCNKPFMPSTSHPDTCARCSK